MDLVTLAQVQAYVQDPSDAQAALLEALADSAEDWLSKQLGVALSERVVTDRLEGGGMYLRPLVRPVLQVLSVIDTVDDSTVTATTYEIIAGRRIRLTDGAYWGRGTARFAVNYIAGYSSITNTTTTTGGGWAAVAAPEAFVTAVLHLVRRAFDAKGGAVSESAAGWSVAWREFAASDIMAILHPWLDLGVRG